MAIAGRLPTVSMTVFDSEWELVEILSRDDVSLTEAVGFIGRVAEAKQSLLLNPLHKPCLADEVAVICVEVSYE
jgi:hypothetical protein